MQYRFAINFRTLSNIFKSGLFEKKTLIRNLTLIELGESQILAYRNQSLKYARTSDLPRIIYISCIQVVDKKIG